MRGRNFFGRTFLGAGILISAFASHAADSSSASSTVPSVTCSGEGTPKWNCKPTDIKIWLFDVPSSTQIVLISHGTQGVDARHFEYATALNRVGISAVVIDHWTTRGIDKVHNDYAGNQSKGGRAPTMSWDSVMVQAWLRQNHPQYLKFGYMGESMGGSSAINLAKWWPYNSLRRTLGVRAEPFDAEVALYPGCFDRAHDDRYTGKPFLFVLAEKDDDTPATHCVEYSAWMNARGGNATSAVMAGEHHDFDGPYAKQYWPKAQNPSQCTRMHEPDAIVWTKTGERFPRTPEGFAAILRQCTSWGITSGSTLDRHVAEPVWTKFFKEKL